VGIKDYYVKYLKRINTYNWCKR